MSEKQAGHNNGLRERRRRLVAAVLLRKPRASQRTVHEDVNRVFRGEGHEGFGLTVIHDDIVWLRQQMIAEANQDYEQMGGLELARIGEVEEEAWKAKDLSLVLSCSKERRKLLGLDRPQRVELTGKAGGPVDLIYQIDPGRLTEALRILGRDHGDSGSGG